MASWPQSVVWRRIIGWVICIAVLGAAAWWLLRPPSRAQSPAMAGMAAMGQARGPMPVGVETMRPVTVPVVLQYLGQTAAFQKVEVRARVAGFLEKRLFEEGASVKESQELYHLERATFEADVEAAKAALAQAEVRSQDARSKADRMKQLLESKLASAEDLETSETGAATAAADVLAAQARLRQARLSLDYTIIRSPLTGVAGKSSKDVGSYLNPQVDAPLVLVQQVDPLYVEFSVTDRDLLRWRELAGASREEGLSVELTLPDGAVYPHQGRVDFVDINVDPSTGTAMIRAEVANPEGLLRPGQLLRVKVLGLERKNVLTVPQQAVIQTAAGPMVYTVSEKNTVQQTPVSLGGWVGDRWVITSGLQPGDRVILDHLTVLTHIPPGVPLPVQPVEAAADTTRPAAADATRPAAGDTTPAAANPLQESAPSHAR